MDLTSGFEAECRTPGSSADAVVWAGVTQQAYEESELNWTTVPAAGNVALGLAFGLGEEIWGSALQLVVNLAGMAVAGWLTLAVQEAVWADVRPP